MRTASDRDTRGHDGFLLAVAPHLVATQHWLVVLDFQSNTFRRLFHENIQPHRSHRSSSSTRNSQPMTWGGWLRGRAPNPSPNGRDTSDKGARANKTTRHVANHPCLLPLHPYVGPLDTGGLSFGYYVLFRG